MGCSLGKCSINNYLFLLKPCTNRPQPTKMSDKKLGFFESFMLSGVAAGVSKTAAAPIERVKLLVQNQDEMIKQGRLDKPYNGVIDCTTRVLKTEGVYPFWRGNLANVLRYFPTQALNFAFKDSIKAVFKTPKDAPSYLKFGTNIASGGAAGTMSLLLVADAGVGISFLLGWAVTVTAGLMSYPIDTVRRRMMMTSGGGVKYKGSMDCFMQVMKNEGFMSLMKGAGANVLRGVAGAGVLAGFDKFKALYIEFRTTQ